MKSQKRSPECDEYDRRRFGNDLRLTGALATATRSSTAVLSSRTSSRFPGSHGRRDDRGRRRQILESVILRENDAKNRMKMLEPGRIQPPPPSEVIVTCGGNEQSIVAAGIPGGPKPGVSVQQASQVRMCQVESGRIQGPPGQQSLNREFRRRVLHNAIANGTGRSKASRSGIRSQCSDLSLPMTRTRLDRPRSGCPPRGRTGIGSRPDRREARSDERGEDRHDN
jgi:hypothetical protein